ncbi:uncharacterized protein [Primulina huaijiensis]|uniref:uncharacterized protein n=1 Tax=Primulina huaijiensis TaxID=1492673 RepID=UPI003CC7244D
MGNFYSNKWRNTSRNLSLCLFPEVAEMRDSFTARFSSKSMKFRSCYIGVSTDLYDDELLCIMMLRDSCFLICYMKVVMGDREMDFHTNHLGASASALMDPDMYMLDNQIPYSVIKILIESEDDKEEEPLHLLKAFQKIFSGDSSRKKSEKNNQDSYNFRNHSIGFRCVNDQKEKGKDFKPSSNCLADVRFESHAFYRQLKLPIWSVSPDDKVFFADMVAFETSPGTRANFTITSYINFRKTLIESSKDVKELKEKGYDDERS